MVPDNLRYGGGVSGTVIHPVVALVMILTGLLMWFLPQRKVIVPFLLASILIPADQILVIGGLHFPTLRVLIFFGMIRIFILKGRGEWNMFSGGLNRVDQSMILLSLTSAVAGVLLFQNTQACVFQLGNLYDAFGAYFLLRCIIRDGEDVVRVIHLLALVVVIVGGVMIVEQVTKGWNPYTLLGGGRANAYAAEEIRDGRVRSMGSFAHPIIAGTFGAVLLPVFVGMWLRERKYRVGAFLGVIGATAMMLASNSSTPFIGYMAGVLGLCLWPIRDTMRVIRWGIVITLTSLHMVMKAPVWHLITRFDISGSSYHRYQLIDTCVNQFWNWWLIGTDANANWGWDMWDAANQYVAMAYGGGLLGLVFFIAIIVYGFKYVGSARQATADKKQSLFFWALGSALLAYVVSFFGISLWDQSIVGWYALVAFICAVAAPRAVQATVPQVGTALDLRIDAEANSTSLRWWERPSTSRKRIYAPLHRRERQF